MREYLSKGKLYEMIKPEFESSNSSELNKSLLKIKENYRSYHINDVISEISIEKTNKAWLYFIFLYEQNKNDFILALVNGISKTDKSNKLLDFLLSRIDNKPEKVTNCLKAFNYKNLENIKSVINKIEEIDINVANKKNILAIYERLIDNELINESNYREEIFTKLRDSINYKNYEIHSKVLDIILSIKVSAEKKFLLLYPFVDCGNKKIFEHDSLKLILDDINDPKLVFKFVKDRYMSSKLSH